VSASIGGMARSIGLIAGGLNAAALPATLQLDLAPRERLTLALIVLAEQLALASLFAAFAPRLCAALSRRVGAPRAEALTLGLLTALLALWALAPALVSRWEARPGPAAIGLAAWPLLAGWAAYTNTRHLRHREAEGRPLPLRLRTLALGMALAGLLAALRPPAAPAVAPAAERASVVLITVDTLRRDHISAYGQSPVDTPAIDALAARGLRYDEAITPLPETVPAHAALFTGLHPLRLGVLSNGHPLPAAARSLVQTYAEAGYDTAAFVSSFAVARHAGLDRGFRIYDDDFSPGPPGLSRLWSVRLASRLWLRLGDPTDLPSLLERSAPQTLARALRFVEAHRARPFFLWVHLFEPHAPYEPHGMPGFEANGRPGAPRVDHRAILSNEAAFTYDEALVARLRALYAEEVAYTDQQVGAFVSAVELTLPEAPWIALTADHGESLGEHGIFMNHHGLYDEVLRVPLILVPPEPLDQGRLQGGQVRLMDLGATLVGLAGLPALPGDEGQDLLAGPHDTPDTDRSCLLVGRTGAALDRGALLGYRAPSVDRLGLFKFIAPTDGGAPELYFLQDDPAEAHNRAPDEAAAVQRLLAHLQTEQAEAAAPAAEMDPAVVEGLRALGYFGD